MLQEEGLGAKAFVRQRRNLLIVSMSLVATTLMELRLETPVSFFGNTISIGNPNAIGVLLWTLWLYFLIRYVAFHVQYQPSDESVGMFFRGWRQTYMNNAAIKAIEIAQPEIKDRNIPVSLQRLNKKGAMRYTATVTIAAMLNAPERTVEIGLPVYGVWTAGVKAFLRASLTYAPTSEYYIPYVVAVMPLVLCIAKSF